MKNTFSLEQISKTGNFDSTLIFSQYKLDSLARFMENKSLNPKLRQDQVANELGWSSSTLKRYRNDKLYFCPIESHQTVAKEDKLI